MSTVYDSAEEVFAEIVGDSPLMDEVAAGIAEAARANAARHTDPSESDDDRTHFADSISVKTAGGGKDRIIANSDPLAIPKELGHILVRDGETVGYVKGQYSMRNAALSFRGPQ
jgi:hypothetical protein